MRTKVGLLAIVAITGVLLNHSSWDIALYSPQSEQQQEAIESGELNTFGPVAHNINFDGSVVSPISSANFLRTLIIDAILLFFALTLIYKTRNSK